MFSKRKKVLVICSKNKQRSLTAERIYQKNPALSVRSAGTSPNARHQVSRKDIVWADVIVCMEKKHKEHIHRLFGMHEIPEIVVADIPDEYPFMNQELCDLLKLEIDALL